MMRMSRLHPVLVIAATFALAVSLSGCQKITRSVRASVSPCFRVLPQAHQALDRQGSFVDVARIEGRAVARFPRIPVATSGGDGGAGIAGGGQPVLSPPPQTSTPSTTVPPVTRDVCVVAYKGKFKTSNIEHLIGPNRTGGYALVIVGVKSQRVRAVLLVDRLPKPLHAH